MKNQFHLVMLALLLPGLVFISCTRPNLENHAEKSHLEIYLTDHPAFEFDSLWLDLRGLELHDGGGWRTANFLPGLYNITDLRNGRDSLVVLDSQGLTGLRKIRLILGQNNFIEKDGARISLLLKESDARPELDIEPDDFDIRPDGLRVWLDVNVAASVRIENSGSGNQNGYRLDLKFSCFGEKATGRLRGEVKPAAAMPWLELMGDNSLPGIPENDGRFEWRGVTAGTYQLKVHALNGYADTLLSGIRIREGEETKLPPIILHR